MMSIPQPPATSHVSIRAWIGVDLDGTLAEYHGWEQWDKIGAVIPRMRDRIVQWLAEGKQVKIFTARVAYEEDTCYVSRCTFRRADMVRIIQDWLEANALPRLAVTHEKDFQMAELWDDRCVQVVPNTGMTLAEHLVEGIDK